MKLRFVLSLAPLAACVADNTDQERQGIGWYGAVRTASPPGIFLDISVTDVGPYSGFQDYTFGHYNRGRGAIVADFDLDDRPDVFLGNPRDESYILRSVTPRGGDILFEPGQHLATGRFAWGGAAADYDNDGDPDLFVSGGGNEAPEADRLYRNMTVEMGTWLADPLMDVTYDAGIELIDPSGAVVEAGTAGTIWFDADNDGWLDMWSNGHLSKQHAGSVPEAAMVGSNQLWINHRDGTFSNEIYALEMESGQWQTRNSAVLDFDNDGDWDIFENNFIGANVLWKNMLQETGTLSFEDVTAEMSLGSTNLAEPYLDNMASIAADVNNDGWQDLFIFERLQWRGYPEFPNAGHQVLLNLEGTGFINVAHLAGELNDTFMTFAARGVMGCQVGDLNADGIPDVFFGNGRMDEGRENQLFMSSHMEYVPIDGYGKRWVPYYVEMSHLIDFPAEHPADLPPVAVEPPYPYRSHGSIIVDFNQDGYLELGVANGGGALFASAVMREPNRLFQFDMGLVPPSFLVIRPYGDGITVNRSGIGTRVKASVGRSSDGETWDVHGTLLGGSGFAAQNGEKIFLGLADADEVYDLEVTWPDGLVESVSVLGVNQELALYR